MPQPDPESLLNALAEALTACEAAGLKPRLRKYAVLTNAGWVLPWGRAESPEWVARFPSATHDGDSPTGGDDDDD